MKTFWKIVVVLVLMIATAITSCVITVGAFAAQMHKECVQTSDTTISCNIDSAYERQ